jgi:hypothetical protein
MRPVTSVLVETACAAESVAQTNSSTAVASSATNPPTSALNMRVVEPPLRRRYSSSSCSSSPSACEDAEILDYLDNADQHSFHTPVLEPRHRRRRAAVDEHLQLTDVDHDLAAVSNDAPAEHGDGDGDDAVTNNVAATTNSNSNGNNALSQLLLRRRVSVGVADADSQTRTYELLESEALVRAVDQLRLCSTAGERGCSGAVAAAVHSRSEGAISSRERAFVRHLRTLMRDSDGDGAYAERDRATRTGREQGEYTGPLVRRGVASSALQLTASPLTSATATTTKPGSPATPDTSPLSRVASRAGAPSTCAAHCSNSMFGYNLQGDARRAGTVVRSLAAVGNSASCPQFGASLHETVSLNHPCVRAELSLLRAEYQQQLERNRLADHLSRNSQHLARHLAEHLANDLELVESAPCLSQPVNAACPAPAGDGVNAVISLSLPAIHSTGASSPDSESRRRRSRRSRHSLKTRSSKKSGSRSSTPSHSSRSSSSRSSRSSRSLRPSSSHSSSSSRSSLRSGKHTTKSSSSGSIVSLAEAAALSQCRSSKSRSGHRRDLAL